MPVAADIVAYLDPLLSEAGGIDLFEGPAPELPDNLVAITHTGGEPGEYTMGASLSGPSMEFARFQLMARNTDHTNCVTHANTCHALLANMGPVTVNARIYHHIENIDGEPFSLGQDDNLRWRYVASYRAYKQRG